MEYMEMLGYAGALLIGLILGLIGGGGAILTVPLLVYGLGINPITATAYSLFVVGSTASVGALGNGRRGFVDYRTGLLFGLPSIVAVYLTRKFLIPAIPDPLFSVGDIVMAKDVGIMIFFATLMLFASLSMIRNQHDTKPAHRRTSLTYGWMVLEGAIVGVLTGIVGAGGGFLIIPALVLFAGLPMKTAVGTSLFIIAIKSLIGFIGDVENNDIEWAFLLIFTAISVLGIFAGMSLSKRLSNRGLKRGFGWFVLFMAVFILIVEIWF